jgi:hypothetical protein
MNDEAMRKYLVTMLVIIHELPLVDVPVRANVLGTIPLERFFSCWRRISHLDYHFTSMMSRLHFVLLMTWLRTFLGLSPDLEEGTIRPKHGDVVLEPLP